MRPILFRHQEAALFGGFAPFLVEPPPANILPKASTLQDNFDDNSTDASKWNVTGWVIGGGTTGGTVAETNARLEITPVTNVGGLTFDGYVSVNKYDLTGDAIYATVSNITTIGSAQSLYFGAGQDTNNYYAIVTDSNSGIIKLQKYIGGVGTAAGSVTYSATTHARWRLRHDAPTDTINFDTATSTSSDPPLESEWTNRISVARDPAFSTNNLYLFLQNGTYTNDLAPVTVRYDGYNTSTAAAVGGTTYNDTLSEGLTGADAFASSVVFPNSITESVTASDSLASSVVFPNTLSESVTAADSLASAVTFPNTLSESVAAGDSWTGGLLITGSFTESITAAYSLANTVIWGPALIESLTGADSYASQAAFVSSLTESLTGGDTLTSTATFNSALGETVAAADALTSVATFPNALTESVTAASPFASIATFPSALSEAVTASSSVSGGLLLTAALSESVAASYSSVGGMLFNATLTETIGAGGEFEPPRPRGIPAVPPYVARAAMTGYRLRSRV